MSAKTEIIYDKELFKLLVNETHPLPDGYEDMIAPHLVRDDTCTGGRDLLLEEETMRAAVRMLTQLKAAGSDAVICGGHRTVRMQVDIAERLRGKYGDEYVRRYVAKPGCSEHHTGLAMDLHVIVDGVEIKENHEAMKETEAWEKVQKRAPEYGFILRYPEGKEEITGVAYEPWHFRYVGVPMAKEITEKGLTLEEYLNS